MVKEFYYRGHHYKVVPIEGCDEFNIIRDGRNVRKVCKQIAELAMQHVEELFR